MIVFRNNVQPFVLMFEGRTGSSHLISMLDNHPRIRASGEALVSRKEKGSAEQLRWTASALTAPLVGRNRAIGFKTKLHDILDPEAFANLLREKQARIIYMYRANTIKAVVSHIRSYLLKQQIGTYNTTTENKRLPPTGIEVKWFEKELRVREERDEALDGYLDALGLPVLRVSYEELLADEGATVRKVCAFLGVAYEKTPSRFVKNTSDDLHKVLLNFEELKAHYAGTRYAPMFDELGT